jgi:hypothetical protein
MLGTFKLNERVFLSGMLRARGGANRKSIPRKLNVAIIPFDSPNLLFSFPDILKN